MCIEREKDNFKSREVNCLKECALALTEVQSYVFDSLLKHQLTRDNSFALIRSCGNEVYKVEKMKLDEI